MAMSGNQSYQSLFTYGATGKVLLGFRDSQIAEQSADTIENFYISEIGTLRVAKKYDAQTLYAQQIVAKRNTKYDFFIIFTSNKIISINKNTLQKISELSISKGTINTYCNINIFNDFIFIKYANDEVEVLAFNSTGNIGTTNFFSTIELPFQQKQDVAFDVYKCFNKDGTITPEVMTTYNKDAELTTDSSGNITLKNSGLVINRVYVQYKSLITSNQLTGATEGMTFIVFKNYQSTQDTLGYYLGNNQITFSGQTNDSKYGSFYFTKATASRSGKLVYGVVENFLSPNKSVIDIVEFQSRLAICTRDKIYFSKILDYNNFVPSLDTDAGFFIKPSTIDGNQPNIIKLLSGNGLYIMCKEGIIVAGYGSSISGTNLSNIKIAGNSQPTKICAMIEDVFYYVDTNGTLRAIITDFESGVIKFANVSVEKYDYDKKQITWVEKININEDNVLAVSYKDSKQVNIYSMIEMGLFRKFALNLDKENDYILSHNNDYISGTKYYKLSNKNVDEAKLVLNLPFIQTESRGVYLNDYLARYNRIVLNIYTPNKNNIKTVSVDNYRLQNLSTSDGNYSIYDFLATLPIIDLTLLIQTNASTDIIEIRGINGFIKGGV